MTIRLNFCTLLTLLLATCVQGAGDRQSYMYNSNSRSMVLSKRSRFTPAPTTMSSQVVIFPKMLHNPQLSNPIVKPDTFEFNCHVDFDASRSDVGFDVMWAFDNKTDTSVPTAHLTGSQRDAVLDQKYLEGHLGQTLTCKVRPYFKNTPSVTGAFKLSNGYWCGIKFGKPSLTVSANDPPQEVKLISTIPIICHPNAQPFCKLELYLDPNNHNALTSTSCTKVLKPTDWNSHTNEAMIRFQVLAQRNPKKNPDRNLALHFSPIFTSDGPPIFNNYNIPYLPVYTKHAPSHCTCTDSIRCKTFDTTLLKQGTVYDISTVQSGEFTMYESTAVNRLSQVQVRTWACGRLFCICAVAAREGNDVIIIDMCRGHYGNSVPQVIIPHKGTMAQGTAVSHDNTGLHYQIDFPSGTKVKVHVVLGSHLDIYVKTSEYDFGATRGLCGSFDVNRDNDLTHKGGGQADTFPLTRFEPKSFIESWRLPVGSSMFDLGQNIPIDPKYNNDIFYCNCDQKTGLVDCTFDNIGNYPAMHTHCSGCSASVTGVLGRKRKATDSSNEWF